MSHFLKHTECPKCRAIGNDRTGNNLGVYSDGSLYCFMCGYYVSATGVSKYKAQKEVEVKKSICLPYDVDTVLPTLAKEYLTKYNITEKDRIRHTILWSETYQRLVFPYFGQDELLGWQGRYLGNDPEKLKKSKWFSQGDLKTILHIVGNQSSEICIVVEDVISAIRISHVPNIAAIPLFGSHLSTEKILQIKYFCDTILVWLDPDMRVKAAKFSHRVRQLGLKSRVIYSNKDPKDHMEDEILNYIQG